MDAPPRLPQPAQARQRGWIGRDRDSLRGPKYLRVLSFRCFVTNTRLQLPTAHCYLASSSFGQVRFPVDRALGVLAKLSPSVTQVQQHASIGAWSWRDGQSLDRTHRDADAALRAKRQGKGRHVVFTPPCPGQRLALSPPLILPCSERADKLGQATLLIGIG